MKVLFDHPNPFFLSHGGFQVQIEQTKAALESIGVDVDYVRWWDDSQRCDIIHFFGRPATAYIQFAQQKKIKCVVGDLLSGLGSRSGPGRSLQKALMISAQTILPSAFIARMSWDAYKLADACVALTPWEAQLIVEMFVAPADQVHCVPNGVEQVFFQSVPAERGPWLVCTATITERKRTLELAEAAVAAQTPVWIIGKPYAESDPYAVRFVEFARNHPSIIRYEGAIRDRVKLAEIYRQARGFVLLSTMESLSLSALEAAACGCPLLLSDLPWARSVFGNTASYCPIGSENQTSSSLRRFYGEAPGLQPPPQPNSWAEVAQKLKTVYELVLSTSR